jgi:hypothetical protein
MSVLPRLPRNYEEDPDLIYMWSKICEAFKLKNMFYVTCPECHQQTVVRLGMRKCQIKHLLDCCLHAVSGSLTREVLDRAFREANKYTGRNPDVWVIGHGEDHARQEWERIVRANGLEPGVPSRPAYGGVVRQVPDRPVLVPPEGLTYDIE